MSSGADNNVHGGIAGINSDPRQNAVGGMNPDGVRQSEESPQDPKEESLVRKFWKDYERTRKFDENFRKQIAIDRRYAAGVSDPTWAVTTNLIGAFIDILTAILYARDPDVSAKKARQVDEENTESMDTFAQTIEIVISDLWKRGRLKKAARKSVRGVLSTAEGWLKCNLLSEKVPQPQTEKALNDARELLEHLQAQLKLIEDPDGKDPEEIEALISEKEQLIADLDEKMELAVNKLFAIDYIPCERMQVSTDVMAVEDHLDANWNSNEEYIDFDEALSRFSRLTVADLESATKFYQQEPKELTTRDADSTMPQGAITAESAQAYVKNPASPDQPCFLRVVEQWCRTDRLIRTGIEGVKRWAVEPYSPPYPTSRFYPYFYLAFYEVDGLRHPQSLSWRLYKLQDEYSGLRSSMRLTRQRSIPGTLFNATMLDEAEARKLQNSKEQEFVPLKPGDPTIPLTNLFAPKPVAAMDMRIYDATAIMNDMERISGVQEALSSVVNGPGNPKTATEANIEQAGTSARTTTDRDALEDMLTDLAQYTAEQALQCVTVKEAMRMAGQTAYWPGPDPDGISGPPTDKGMSIDDLFTMVEISIKAGSTGKPSQSGDQQAWATILPLLKETIQQIRAALGSGDDATAQALIELVKETMKRLGDDEDPDRFIPKVPPPGSPGAGAPPPPDMPKMTVQIKGMIDPATSAALVAPALRVDAMSAPPPGAGAPGAPPSVAHPVGAGPMPPPGATPAPGPGPGASPGGAPVIPHP